MYGKIQTDVLPTKALMELAGNMTAKRSAEDLFASPNFPRFLYKAAAEMGWRQQTRQNGLKPRDLFLQKKSAD